MTARPFTYYCWDHRDMVAFGPSPNTRHKSGGWVIPPSCPVCQQSMYWVPDGGTVVPPSPDDLLDEPNLPARGDEPAVVARETIDLSPRDTAGRRCLKD